ncbi:MAG TPA: carbon monoxide dehydrogenase subunit G [Chloroflexia bacterium]|nr:carbon monoxide dehydrogenase subunit G [Chloroflexia bacterium]
MELTGSHTFAAPQERVWAVLTDPETLRRSLPGCQQFDLQPDGAYRVTMSIGIAAIKGTYTGTVHMLDEQPPDRYALKVGAKGAAGFVDGRGNFTLVPLAPDQTRVSYTGQAQVGGKIAGVGQRLLQAGAQMIAGQFFKALDKEVQRGA